MLPLPAMNLSEDALARSAGIRRMRRIALGLLGLVTAVFIGTHVVESVYFPNYLPPAITLVRAFAEAAMVGAIADWFAVVALFRHPLGLPIPHTAVIPRKHARIAAAIGRFIADNLLASAALAQRLEELDPAGRLAAWLDQPETAAMIARRTASILPPALETIGESRLRTTVGTALRRGIDVIITPQRMAGVLSFAANQNYHQSLLDLAVQSIREFVGRHEDFIRTKVAARCGEWIPLWVETKLADSIVGGIDEALAELAKPDHPQRREIDQALRRYIDDMAVSPEFVERLEEIKSQILADPAIDAFLDQSWREFYGQLAGEVASLESVTLHMLDSLSRRLQSDPALRQGLNQWLRQGLERILVPQREFIGSIITDLIMRWRTDTLVDRFESHVGQDLQYIRINGTLVGGLAGIVIHMLTMALGH